MIHTIGRSQVFASMFWASLLPSLSYIYQARTLFQALFSFNHHTKPMSGHYYYHHFTDGLTVFISFPVLWLRGDHYFSSFIHWRGSWNFSGKEGKGLVHRSKWFKFNLSKSQFPRGIWMWFLLFLTTSCFVFFFTVVEKVYKLFYI